MTDVRTALTTLGWRVDTNARLVRGITDFQRAWNLGDQLEADGNAGPKTLAALDESIRRHNAGLPDISEHFFADEWACQCGGKYADCRRIWSVRAIIRGAETFRSRVGPFEPARPNRCPGENKRVKGASRSQHLYGYALDVPVYKITVAQVRALGLFSGIGYYTYGTKQYVRHVDMRHLHGDPGTPKNPVTWEYPNAAQHTPQDPRPDLANAPQEDEMSAEDSARLKTLEATVNTLAATLAGRYKVESNRYSHLAGLTQSVAAETTALKATVGVLANAQGLNPELVQKTITDAVSVALSKITLTNEES